jgi:hypothetical protein
MQINIFNVIVVLGFIAGKQLKKINMKNPAQTGSGCIRFID